MSGSGINVELKSVDDLFSTEESRQDAAREKVMEIALSELYPFPDHPFSIREDDSMKETVESIKEYGVLSPAIARPRADGGYEATGASGPVSWRGWRRCRSLSVIWTQILLQFLWWTVISRGRIFCLWRKQRRTK